MIRNWKPVVAIALMVGMVAVGEARLPRNSFINRPVTDTADLIRHIREDRVVMDRYMRHFHMTRQEVIAYLSPLRLTRLQRPGTYRIYGVPHTDGVLHSSMQTLPRGELVFVDAGGNLVLQHVCGNPFSRGPVRSVTPNTLTAMVSEDQPPQVLGELPKTEDFVPVNHETLMSAMEPVIPDTPVAPPVFVPEIATVGAAPIAAVVGGGGVPWFLPVLAVPALIGGGGGGGGGDEFPPVPEPATIAVLALGAAAVAARRRRAAK